MSGFSSDQIHMQQALALARDALGTTAPNPSVGCLIVKDEQVIGSAATAKGGRPHAETQALAMAGEKAKGATAYVTLEPCSHQGKTPPCAEALIHAGIARAYVACTDPNPEVNGKGIQMLKAAGIEVIEGVCEAEAKAVNKGFFKRMAGDGCEVTVKIATTQDGSFTLPGQRWITGEAARQEVQRMRAHHDAILTGIGTVLSDDPELTCRIPGMEDRSPKAFVLDSHLRFPETAKLARAGTTIFTLESSLNHTDKIRALMAKGVEVAALMEDKGRVSLLAAVSIIGAAGYNRLMVEAGPEVSKAFLVSRFTDTLCWFKAPLTSGKRSELQLPADTMKCVDRLAFGPDVLEIYESSK